MKRLCWALYIGLVALGCADDASGQNYPSRTIRIVVPFPAGGGVDTMARIWATSCPNDSDSRF